MNEDAFAGEAPHGGLSKRADRAGCVKGKPRERGRLFRATAPRRRGVMHP
jgi:hypothetical protein